MNNATKKLIAELYADGDRDILHFEYVYGGVKFDEADKPRSQDVEKLIAATLSIFSILVESGDFNLFEAKFENEKISHHPKSLDDEQIEKNLLRNYAQSKSEMDFGYQYFLKKNEIGKIPSASCPDILGQLR